MVVGEFAQEADFVVVGGGPGGYSAALRAAELGVKTTLVDASDHPGGAWLASCIPVRAFVHLAQVIHCAEQASESGVAFGSPRIDFAQMRRHLLERAERLGVSLVRRCDDLGVQRINGQAKFESAREIRVSNVRGAASATRLHFRRALIATGSVEGALPETVWEGSDPRITPAGASVWLDGLPRRLLVIGGDGPGVELAGSFAAFGSKVTLVTPHDRLAPLADADLIARLAAALTSAGVEIRIGRPVRSLTTDDDAVHALLGDDADAQAFDHVIVALGRQPRTSNLGLEQTSVQLTETGAIRVDEQMRTMDGRIFAAGDVTGLEMLSHTAAQQGRVAAEVVAGWGSVYEPRAVPHVMYTVPQVAWCGLTEAQALESGHTCEVVVQAKPAGDDDAVDAIEEAPDVTKLIFERDTQLLLGVGLVGQHAGERIGEGVLAIEMGAVRDDIEAVMHPPLTSGVASEARCAAPGA